MTDFVLIHGAFHGAWVWNAIVERLERNGHRVFAPDLPGAGADPAGSAYRVSLSDQIDAVVDLVDRHDLNGFTLVGHSMSGMVITGVADRVRNRVDHLVYLDALVPRAGQSVRDLVPAEMYQGALAAIGGRGSRPLLPPIFPVEKFVDLEGDAAAAFMAKLTPQPFLTIVEPLFLLNPPVQRRTFIYCSGVPFGAFDAFAEQARDSADWRYFALDTPHDAMLVAPDRLAEILIQCIACPDG